MLIVPSFVELLIQFPVEAGDIPERTKTPARNIEFDGGLPETTRFTLLDIDFTDIPVSLADIMQAYSDGTMSARMSVELSGCADLFEFFEVLIDHNIPFPRGRKTLQL